MSGVCVRWWSSRINSTSPCAHCKIPLLRRSHSMVAWSNIRLNPNSMTWGE